VSRAEGELRAGDSIARLERGSGPTIREVLATHTPCRHASRSLRPEADEFDPAAARYVARIEAVPDRRPRARDAARPCGRPVVIALTEKAAFRYAPGKWTVTEIAGTPG